MRAVVFSEWQTFPTLEKVDQPEPGPGEVLLKVAGAGACHSDVAIYKDFAKDAPGSIPPPRRTGFAPSRPASTPLRSPRLAVLWSPSSPRSATTATP